MSDQLIKKVAGNWFSRFVNADPTLQKVKWSDPGEPIKPEEVAAANYVRDQTVKEKQKNGTGTHLQTTGQIKQQNRDNKEKDKAKKAAIARDVTGGYEDISSKLGFLGKRLYGQDLENAKNATLASVETKGKMTPEQRNAVLKVSPFLKDLQNEQAANSNFTKWMKTRGTGYGLSAIIPAILGYGLSDDENKIRNALLAGGLGLGVNFLRRKSIYGSHVNS